jgi:hypothetical protein
MTKFIRTKLAELTLWAAILLLIAVAAIVPAEACQMPTGLFDESVHDRVIAECKAERALADLYRSRRERAIILIQIDKSGWNI